MKKIILGIILSSFFIFHGISQTESPYVVNWKWDGISLGASLGINAVAYSVSLNVVPYTEYEINQIPYPNLFKWDKYSTSQSSGMAAEHSNNLLFGSFAIPLVLLAPKRTRQDAANIGLLYLQSLSYTTNITSGTKQIFLRPRPLVFNPDVDIRKKTEVSARHSFISGHTSIVAATSFFSAKVFNDYFPDSKLRIPVWVAASALTATTGYLRVRAGRHYFTDVLAGGLTGAAIGILVPALHKKKINKLGALQISPGFISNGASINMTATF